MRRKMPRRTKRGETLPLSRKWTTQEKARNTELKLDIDASLEAAPGVFLPPGEGLFAFDGKAILPLTQAATAANLSKKQLLKQVLVPVPIVPTRQTVSIAGRARALCD